MRVVGTSRMRDVDPGWPAPGTKLHHSFGMWPLLIDDTTEAIEIEPASAWFWKLERPVGKARVEITSTQRPTARWSRSPKTSQTGPTQLVPQPVQVAGIDVRNRETLRRLAYLAGGRT